jgi:hypothetical protein
VWVVNNGNAEPMVAGALGGSIARVSTQGDSPVFALDVYAVPSIAAVAIAVGSDGAPWFTNIGASTPAGCYSDSIGQITNP